MYLGYRILYPALLYFYARKDRVIPFALSYRYQHYQERRKSTYYGYKGADVCWKANTGDDTPGGR